MGNVTDFRQHSALAVHPGAMAGAGRNGASAWPTNGVDHEPPPLGAPPRGAPLPAATDVPLRDCDELFDAICARLTALDDASPAHGVSGGDRDSDRDSIRDSSRDAVLDAVRDCVETMQRLQVSFGHERRRNRRLELELFNARSALAQARVELVGSRSDERRSRRLALHDDLTSLPNRSFFGQWLDQTLVDAAPAQQPFAVLYLDLDGFKAINDSYGHAVGDELLRIVASRLTRAVRAEDVVSRLGGDEFACLLTNLPSRDQLSQLACKLFDAVAAPVKIGTQEMTVLASIGIAMCPTDGADAQVLLRNADAAMYHAKRQRCGYSFFDQDVGEPRHNGNGAGPSETSAQA